MAVRQKILSFDSDWRADWNHPWALELLAPMFIFIGGIVGYLYGTHLVDSSQSLIIIEALFMIGTLIIGYILLAVIDEYW